MTHPLIDKLRQKIERDAEPYSDHYKICGEHLLPLVEKLVQALRFECGNRCAYQNPCNAKEVLLDLEKYATEGE